MSLTEATDLKQQEQRIVDELEERRDLLEELVARETPFADHARNALAWLDEHGDQEGDDGA